MVSWMWFHLSSAVLVGQSLRASSMITQVWHHCPGCLDVRLSFPLRVGDTFGHITANQEMVSFTVRAVEAAGSANAVQQGSSGDCEIQLVPVIASGVMPGHSVV